MWRLKGGNVDKVEHAVATVESVEIVRDLSFRSECAFSLEPVLLVLVQRSLERDIG